MLALPVLATVACGSDDDKSSSATASPTTTAVATTSPANPLIGVPGIVDPYNRGWPREVETMNGRVSIKAPPRRIHTLSLGFDEVTYGLVPANRVVAVGKFTQDAESSNVASLAANVPGIGREAEAIVAQTPDLVLASAFSKPELITSLKNAGLTVVQLEQHNDPAGRIADIMLLGYIYGEEDRAVQLATEVRDRYNHLSSLVSGLNPKKKVLSITSSSDQITTAGADTTEEHIIEAAGAVNAAMSLTGHPTVSDEGIITMAPEVIIIPQSATEASAFRDRLLTDEALATVPAIANKQVYGVAPKFFTTLSFWNLRGSEELARMVYPRFNSELSHDGFSFPE